MSANVSPALAERPEGRSAAIHNVDVSDESLSVIGLIAITVQLALAVLVMHQFHVESRTFFGVAMLAAVGFVPHALLPRAWRLHAFVALSAAALVLVVGSLNTLWLLGAGVALVGICHLPVRLLYRVAMLVAAGAGFAAARMGWLPSPWDGGVWAVFGAIFMFRLALYLHAVEFEAERPTVLQAAAYFLMLPNPVFPLFPVVDFGTFVRTHFAGNRLEIYQTGVAWIARGLVHLLLYRVVYQHLPADPLALDSLSGFLWYLLGTFLLYLRVSGQFHVIVGMLHVYGFALPETHKLFLLSSSFTDFWRRINIYWKDFMMKLVYYPSFFRFRRWGATVAMTAATVIVFVVTWLLHSYQWFWILGTFPLTLPDLLFWGILGVLVVVASLREAKRGRDRALGARRWSGRLAVRVLITFTTITILWSLWSAESIVEWLWTWRAAARVDTAGVIILLLVLSGGAAIAGRNWSAPQLRRAETQPWWTRRDVRTVATLLVLVVLAQPSTTRWLGAAGPYVASARLTTLNRADAAVEQRGYYERLDHAPRLGARGWEAAAKAPQSWVGFPATGMQRRRDDFRQFDLHASMTVSFFGREVSTNAWRMRDAPRTPEPRPNTLRMAFLGPSFVFGSGVGDGEPFPAQLERLLNAEESPRTGLQYEALNFGVPAYSILHQLSSLEEDGFRFMPNVVVVAGYVNLAIETTNHLATIVDAGAKVPYAGLDSLLRRWHASPRLPFSELRGLMRIAAPEVNDWAIREIARQCRQRGAIPVFLALDLVGVHGDSTLPALRTAADAGFVVLNLFDVYGPPEGHDALKVAAWDVHPNAAGHARIARRLLTEFQRTPALFSRPRVDAGSSSPAPRASQ
jgi:hypothetical protein